MSTSKHTPGPWTAKRSQGNASILNQHFRLSQGDSNMPLAYLPCVLLSEGEPAANARLIAAAPDLLAALREMHAIAKLYSGDAEPGSICEGQMQKAVAAIAKAEGRAE